MPVEQGGMLTQQQQLMGILNAFMGMAEQHQGTIQTHMTVMQQNGGQIKAMHSFMKPNTTPQNQKTFPVLIDLPLQPNETLNLLIDQIRCCLADLGYEVYDMPQETGTPQQVLADSVFVSRSPDNHSVRLEIFNPAPQAPSFQQGDNIMRHLQQD